MSVHLGHYNTATTRTHVRLQFSTHAQTGANVAPSSALEAADIRIYRAADGAAFSATQRSSASGITMTSPFDSGTGLHDVDIDLTDNTDAGFYAAGYLYAVWLWPDETIDALAVIQLLGYFEIGPPPANMTQISGDATAADNLETMLDGTGGNTLSLGSLAVTGGVTFANSGGVGLSISGNGSSQGVYIVGGATGKGLHVAGGGSGGEAVYFQSQSTSDAFSIAGSGNAIKLYPGGSGVGIEFNSISVSGNTVFTGTTTYTGAFTAANASNDIRVDARKLGGTTQTGRDVGLSVLISSGTGTGQLDVTSGRIKADTVYFGGSAGSFTTGVPSVNTTLISGSLVSTSTAQLGVNVVNFGGSAGTFASGRPEVNTTHWGGTAVASANVRANLIQIGGDTQSGTDLKDFVDTGYDPASHKVAGVVLVDTLTTYTSNTPQTGDAYAIVNSGTYGNSALKTEVLAVQSSLVTIFNDTDELQQDWTNGGRLDLLVDSIITTLGSAGAGLTGIPKTGYKLASDGLDSVLVEAVISASAALVNDSGTQLTSINGRQALALILAAAAAKLSGAEGATLDLKPAGKPSASSRVTATCDTDGNRTPTTVRVPD